MAAQTALFSTNLDTVFNQFVAVGAGTRSMKSLDGETWTSTTLTGFPAFTNMAFGKNILVALAQTVNTAGMVYTTPSAEALGTWTNRPLAPATGIANIGWQDVAFGNNIWVAVGGGIDTTVRTTGTCTMTSSNSANWTKYTGLTAANWRCVAFGQGKFVTLSYGSNLARYSTDGQTWSNGDSLPIGNWRNIVYDPSNTRFVAVALQGVKIIAGTANCTSLQFTTGTNTITRVTGSFITDGYLTGQKIVVSGTTNNNGVKTITGTVNALTITVTEALTNEGPLSTIASINSRDGDGVAYSTDGISWALGSPTTPLVAARWVSIETNGTGRCFTIANDTAGQIVAYTDDGGTNWTTVTLPLIATWSSIAYGSSGGNFHRWVAVNNTVANCAYSDDNGLTWSLGPMSNFVYSTVKWVPFSVHTNDTLTITRGATITVDTDQHPALTSIPITNGKLLIKNTSTTRANRFVTARTTAAAAQAITPADGLGTIDIQGNWIQIGTGDNSVNQTMTVPYTDYVPALWVETAVSSGIYEIWLNVSGAYGGTLKQYQDGLLDVGTGARGKFFIQTPNAVQDKYITATATITFGLFSVLLDSIEGIYQGASITGQGIPFLSSIYTVIEKIPRISASTGRTLTFATDETITTSSGSFIYDGFEVGDSLIITGTSNNDGTYTILTVTATVITVSGSLNAEGPLSNTATIKVNKVILNQLPVSPGNSYTASGYTNVSVKITNPYSSQFTNQVVFGDGVNGNKLATGLKVRIPNIMITSDTPAILHTGSQLLGCYFNLGSGGNMLIDTCLFDEAYHNWNQTQLLTIANVGQHIRPALTETYALSVNGWGLGMPAVRRYNTGNIWLARDIRDTYTNSLLMNYISNAIFNNVVMVLQAPHAVSNGTITAPIGMFNLSFSDLVTVTNVRMYSLNTTRTYQYGLALSNPVTNSTFTNIEYYGGPMLSSQYSSSNTFTNLINSETMFSHSHNYIAGTRFTHDPSTETDLVPGTKYYFKSRTFFTRDRSEYAESRVYEATPFKGSTYFPDYITAFVNAPKSVTFGWTHRTPMYTADTSPLANSNAKNFLEIYRGTSAGFTKDLTTKVAGLNNAPSLTIPTIVTWANDARTLTIDGTGAVYTITASTGNFITDGYLTGDKITIRGSIGSLNNKTCTISNVTATVITVTESLTTQATYAQGLSIVAKYIPTPKLYLTAAGGRTLTFKNATVTASGGRTLTFGGTVALPSKAPTMTAAGGNQLQFFRSTSTITSSASTFVTDGFLTGDKIYITGTTSNNTMPGNYFTLSAVAAGTLTVTPASDFLVDEGPISVGTISAIRTTISCSSGSFITDGFVVGGKIKVTGTTDNNTSGGNYITTNSGNQLAITAVAATMITCSGDFVFPEGPLSSSATLASHYVLGSSGSFITDGYAGGDIVEVTGSANAGNNTTFTVNNVTATVLSFSEETTTQAAESSGALLTTKTMPIPRSVFLNASPNREIAFQKSIAQAAATTRIMTFDYINRIIRSTGTVPGNFLTEGFMVGDKISVTNTTLNNKVVFTLTAVTATLLTLATTDRVYDETSTTATLTANRIKASTGSFITDVWAIGDVVTVTGTTSNDGNYTVNNVVALALSLTSSVVNETLSYRSGAVITATKLISRQKIYGTAARTFTTTAAAKTLTLSSGSMLQDGYIVGDKVLVSGMGTDGNHIYTISTLTTVILTWLEAAAPTTSLVAANAVAWVHTGNRPTILGSVATQTWDAVNKYLTLSVGTWDVTYGFTVGDKILVTGQRYNNGLFTIAAILNGRVTVTEPVIHDPTVYNAATHIIYGYYETQKKTVTASGSRTWLFDNISKKLTASSGSFILDGYFVGDCVQISGTPGGVNDGYFTISGLSATIMYFNELIYPISVAITATATLSAPDIANDTDYYYVVRKYDDTNDYHDSEEIFVRSTLQEPVTNLCLSGTAFTNNKLATLHATAARTLQFVNATKKIVSTGATSFITETYAVGDKLLVTRTAANDGYYTIVAVAANEITVLENLVNEGPLSTSGAITNIYWDNLNVPLFTASAVRTLQFTTATSTGRTMSFSVSTITCLSGSFITDGFITGDKIIITGTSANNGIFTVTGTVNALTMTVTESFVTESTASTTIMIRCRKITLAGTTPGSFITDGYAVNDRITLAGTTSNNATFTIATVETTKITVYEATVAEGPLNATATITCLNITTGALTRISPFLSHAATQSADAYLLTSNIDNATLTQPISTAIDNAYTFSVWVATQPTILKVTTLTAAPARTFKFDGLSLTATGGRTLQWAAAGSTITASTGSFHADGYTVGDKLIVTGTTNNNGTFTITTLTPTVITVAESLINEGPLSATANIAVNKITAYGTTPGNFVENGFQIGDKIQTLGYAAPPAGSLYNIGWFTITNVLPHIINVAETIVTEAVITSVLTITDNFHDNFTIDGEIRFGTAVQTFTATPLWQKISVTFTATAKLHNAVIQIDTQKRGLCVIGAMVNTGSAAQPYLVTGATPTTIINKVRDIATVRTWCRAYGEAASHSGIEVQLAAAYAATIEMWTEVYCGTTANFTPTFKNKVFDTWAGSGQTIVFNNESSNNVVNGFSQSCVCAPTNYGLAYFAAASSGNRIMNLTYDLDGATQAYLASFNTQSNNQSFYNWNIKHWRNYASIAGNAAIFQTSNATSGLVAENIIMDNSDFPIMDNALNFTVKGMSGGNVKPLNSALLNNLPVTPVYTLANTPAAAVNFDSVTSALTATNYTTVYDTIFKELYHTSTTGSLFIQFNASAKASKPYVLSGNANFSNSGRLYLITAGDSIEYTWPHKIIGVSGFQNVPFLLDGVDLGNTLSKLEGLKIEYKIDTTGSGYPVNWTEATPASLSALTVSPTAGFYLKLKLTAMAGMKYSTLTKRFVVGESIRGLSSLATAVVDRDFYMPVQGTLWLSSIVGTFVPGEIIVSNEPSRDGEMRALNVATNTTFALFPSVTSYVDGLQIYTTVDQTAKYPAKVVTITLANIVPGSIYYIFNSDTNVQIATGTASGTPVNGETTIDYSFSVIYTADTNITVNVRKSSAPAKYFPYQTGSTITQSGASVFIAQIFDTVIIDLYAGISDDFTVDTSLKTIKHTSGTTVYTVKQLYSWLLDYFDEAGFVDDQMPIAASTPTEYNLINGWFIDDPSFKFLTGGAITSIGHASEIYVLTMDGIPTNPEPSDININRIVQNGAGTHRGTLLAYTTTAPYKWYVRKTLGVFTAEAVTIETGGTGAGTVASVATGESIWSNIFTLGSLVASTTLDVYQNDIQITPWWPTDAGHIDILVKVKEADVQIDSSNLTILARTYGSLYDHFVINAPAGRNPVPLAAFADGNNQTAIGTVSSYAGFSFAFGTTLKDMINGNGSQPYDCIVQCGGHTILEVYQYLKFVTRSGSSTILNGVEGEFYTGTGDVRFEFDNLTNTFVEGELITGTSGARGYLVSLTATAMVLRNVHGTFVDNMAISGATATAQVFGSVTTITPQKQAPFGTLAGGQFFGARGVWLENVALVDSNNFQLIDSLGVTQAPPSFISVSVSGLEIGDIVSVFRTTGNNKIIDKTYLHSHTTNNSASTVYWETDASTPIPTDTPASGFIRLVKTSTNLEERIAYSSWTGNIFTLASAHSGGYSLSDTAYVPFIDKTAASTTESTSFNFVTNRYVYSLVRHKGIVPFDVKGQIVSTGYSLTAIRTIDSIVAP